MHKLYNILVLEKNCIICTSVFYTDLYLEGTFQDTSKSFKPTEVGFEISINQFLEIGLEKASMTGELWLKI